MHGAMRLQSYWKIKVTQYSLKNNVHMELLYNEFM